MVIDGVMNRKLRLALAVFGAVVFFVLFLKVFTALVAAFVGAAIGFCFIWILAGWIHWYCTKQMHCAYKNIEYMNKLASEHSDEKLKQDKNPK